MTLLRLLACAAALSLAAPATAEDVSSGTLRIEHAWSRPGIPNRPAAAYMEITNAGDTDETLVGARSEAFGAIELHSVEMSDGVMKMRPVERIEIPAGETVALAPGGFHLMLFGADAPFAVGEDFPLALSFARAGEVSVTVSVQRDATGGGGEGGGMDHSGHGSGG